MNRPTGVIVIGIILVLLLIGACGFVAIPWMGGYGSGNWGMMGPWMMGGFGFPFSGGIGVLIFGVFIIVGIALLVAWFAGRAGQSSVSTTRGESPLDILKVRYAKGEITREQYEEMRRDLG